MCKGTLSIFDFDRVDYRVSNKNAEVTISMVFWDIEDGTADIIPISGFPRKIISESSLNMPSSPSFGIVKISAEEFWTEMNSDRTNYPKPAKTDNEENESSGSFVLSSKDTSRGIWQEAGRFWETRRVLRRRDFMQVRRLTSPLTPQRSPSSSSARVEVSSDEATPTTQNDVEVRVNLPIREGEEPQVTNSQPMDVEPTTFEVGDEEDQLTKAIQLSIQSNQGVMAGGTNLVASERAIALSLLEGRGGPLDFDFEALQFDPDEFDKEVAE
ncbi:hypothetical protein ONZ43_g3530 [Nemania bipapillata]|uniref:Uncharacterized protein n=1 Tax=Nemania bipapillata TaxID=110536 RepID=A0ACC2IWH7_9PEZI|nr:hypothetical protein ONZ43_g3530 [Nemania bipapillata]